MRLRGWASLLGFFTITSMAGASIDVQNIGLDASLGILLDGHIVAFRTLESRSGMTDLNGDGDAVDPVLQVLDVSTGAVHNTGFEASGGVLLDGSVIGFRVIEQRQGNMDLNGDGDVFDIVQFSYDVTTGVITNLGLATLSFSMQDGRVAFTVGEASQGNTDLNGDGDVSDLVLHVFDPSSGMVTNLGLDAGNGFVVGAEGVAFAVSEARQAGTDLNGDGDLNDGVLHFYDAASGLTKNLSQATLGGKFALEDGLLVFAAREASQGGTDLNGDGDAADEVLHVYDVGRESLLNVGRATSLFTSSHGRVAFAVSEASDGGVDANGDGDAADAVLHLFDSATGGIQNTAFSVVGFQMDAVHVAFAVDEAGQGGSDLNGDSDAADLVLHLRDLGSGMTRNLATDASLGFELDGDALLAFGAHESAQGVDLNGDGDLDDFVLHVFDILTESLINLAVDPSGGFQMFQLDGRFVSFGVQERAQGETDLNDDGDFNDIVLHLFDVSTGTTENVGFDVAVGHLVDEGRLVFGVTESRQGMMDLNGDGDTTDIILHVATLEVPEPPEPESATAEEMLRALMADLIALGLPHGIEHSRMVHLEKALSYLQAGDPCSAIQSLRVFILQVHAQAGKKISHADAAALVADAEAIITMIASESPECGAVADAQSVKGKGTTRHASHRHGRNFGRFAGLSGYHWNHTHENAA